MKVILDGMLRAKSVHPDILKQIKKDLTIKNPEYINKMKRGIPVYLCGDKEIELWKIEKGEIVIPRGYWAKLWEITDGKFELEDNRVKFPPMKYPKNPQLRGYQAPAVPKAIDWQQGIVMMPCGGGKTNTALSIAASTGQPTLWITHTTDLLHQSMERAMSWLGLSGEEIGLIQGKSMRIGTHVTFATVQTLANRDLSKIKDKFGCIVVDECHLCFKDSKSRLFESVLSKLPAYYRFGVTASDLRSDGLISTMYHVIGPKFYEISQAQLNDAGNVVVPNVRHFATDFKFELEEDEKLNVQQMYAAMRNDSDRMDKLKDILSNQVHENDYCLALGHSLEMLQELQEYCMSLGRPAAFVNGKTNKKDRAKIMKDMQNGKYQYLFATYQLAKLGLDIPRLNKLVMLTPTKDKTSVQQSVGRIMRPSQGKDKPWVYDVVDVQIPHMRSWMRGRQKVYKSLEIKIMEGQI